MAPPPRSGKKISFALKSVGRFAPIRPRAINPCPPELIAFVEASSIILQCNGLNIISLYLPAQ